MRGDKMSGWYITQDSPEHRSRRGQKIAEITTTDLSKPRWGIKFGDEKGSTYYIDKHNLTRDNPNKQLLLPDSNNSNKRFSQADEITQLKNLCTNLTTRIRKYQKDLGVLNGGNTLCVQHLENDKRNLTKEVNRLKRENEAYIKIISNKSKLINKLQKKRKRR